MLAVGLLLACTAQSLTAAAAVGGDLTNQPQVSKTQARLKQLGKQLTHQKLVEGTDWNATETSEINSLLSAIVPAGTAVDVRELIPAINQQSTELLIDLLITSSSPPFSPRSPQGRTPLSPKHFRVGVEHPWFGAQDLMEQLNKFERDMIARDDYSNEEILFVHDLKRVLKARKLLDGWCKQRHMMAVQAEAKHWGAEVDKRIARMSGKENAAGVDQQKPPILARVPSAP